MVLTERKLQVLEAIIEDYIETAAPVGSRTLARKHGLGFSPATIRNEMSDLEELGFLEQPHASAGRVPSDKGYRLYVDNLMKVRQLAFSEIASINELYRERTGELEYMIHLTTRVLSEMTSCLGLVEGPRVDAMACKAIQLLPLTDGQALLVIVTDGGLVQHKLLDLPEGATGEELAYVSSILNRHLTGESLTTLRRHIVDSLRSELNRYHRLVEMVMNLLTDTLASPSEERVSYSGTSLIINQPEFRDVERVRDLLRSVECVQVIRELLSQATTSGPAVVMIGGEIWQKEMRDCSIVVAPYYIGGRLVGRLGVLGPRRMEYGRMVALVTRISEVLSEALKHPADRQ